KAEIADASWISGLITERLVTLGPSFQFVPNLAENVRWVKPARLLRFKIADRKFSDGTKVTLTDVVRTIKECVRISESVGSLSLTKIVGYNEFNSGKSDELSGLQIKDDSEIEIELSESSPLLLDDLSHESCAIVKPGKSGE